MASRLRADMRKLWEDHVTWTRLFIVSASSALPDLQVTRERLLKNQEDIGNAIKPFYGNAAGDQLTALLKGHIVTAAEVLTAAKNNDDAGVRAASARWTANADSIATFLSHANPQNWPEGALKDELHHHLDLTTQEVVAQLHQDWAGSVRAYDQVHEQALKMADMLSDGIIHQFPSRVASR